MIRIIAIILALMLVACDGPDPRPTDPVPQTQVIVTDHRATGQPGTILVMHVTVDRVWTLDSGGVAYCDLPASRQYDIQYLHPDGDTSPIQFDLADGQTIRYAVIGTPPRLMLTP